MRVDVDTETGELKGFGAEGGQPEALESFTELADGERAPEAEDQAAVNEPLVAEGVMHEAEEAGDEEDAGDEAATSVGDSPPAVTHV